MRFWNFLEEIIRHPPSIIAFVVTALVAAHLLEKVLTFITNRQQKNSLIITLELIVVLVLSYLAVHLYNERAMEETSKWTRHEPFYVAILLVVFTLVSALVYLLFKATIHEEEEEQARQTDKL